MQVARAERLPTISATTGVRYQNALGSAGNNINLPPGTSLPPGTRIDNVDTSQTVGLSATVPLFQAGAVAAGVRQAQARRSQLLEQAIATERNVVANARNAFEGVVSSQEVIRASEVAVQANELALEGTRQENLVGSRTILDVLDAEQELFTSEVNLVRAQRELVVASYQLKSAIGELTVDDLRLGVETFDPTAYYQRNRTRLFGLEGGG